MRVAAERARLEQPRGTISRQQLGSRDRRGTIELMEGSGGRQVIDMRRPSIWSNPFTMHCGCGPREALRVLVCVAFQEWWSERTTPVDAICGRFGLLRGPSWSGDEVAASEERVRGLARLRLALDSDYTLVLGCACPMGKVCHTQLYARMLRSRV